MTDLKKLVEQYIKDQHNPELKYSLYKDLDECLVFEYNNELYVGPGPIIIDKSSKRFFEYGSAYSVDSAIEDYRNQIKNETLLKSKFPDFDIQKRYDMVIEKIFRKMQLINKLLELKLTYIVPEIVGTSIFRIPRGYSFELLSQQLQLNPCTFHNISRIHITEVFKLNLDKKTVDFNIIEHHPIKRETNSNQATEKDLEPIW